MNQMNNRAFSAKKDSGAHQLGPTSGAHIADSKRNQLQLEQPRGKDMKDGGVTSIELLKSVESQKSMHSCYPLN